LSIANVERKSEGKGEKYSKNRRKLLLLPDLNHGKGAGIGEVHTVRTGGMLFSRDFLSRLCEVKLRVIQKLAPLEIECFQLDWEAQQLVSVVSIRRGKTSLLSKVSSESRGGSDVKTSEEGVMPRETK